MIRQRPDRDGLQVQVYAGRDPLTGRKHYVSRQVPGKGRAALKAAKQVEAELLPRSAPVVTGARAPALWLSCWSAGSSGARMSGRSRPTTVMSYRGDLDRYILPALGKLPVRQLDAATLDTFYAQLRTGGGKHGRPLSASTVREVHAILSGALMDFPLVAGHLR